MHPFWQALSQLPLHPQVLAVAKRHLEPAPLDRAQRDEALLQALVQAFDRWYLPPSALQGSVGQAHVAHTQWMRLWRPVLALFPTLHPAYPDAPALRQALEQVSQLSRVALQEAESILLHLLDLTAQGGLNPHPTAGLPEHWLSMAAVQRWVGGFPPRLGWASLTVLEAAGWLTPSGHGGWMGYRAFMRYSTGALAPKATSDTLREWLEALNQTPSPHLLGLAASAFGGAQTALGLAGPCGDLPTCAKCPLVDKCQWQQQSGGVLPHNAAEEALARVTAGQADQVPTLSLLVGALSPNNPTSHHPAGEWATALENALAQGLHHLQESSAEELTQTYQLPPDMAAKLMAVLELGQRFSAEPLTTGVALNHPEAVYRHFRATLAKAKQEHFVVVLLDTKNQYLGEQQVSQGTLERTLASPREVFAHAITQRAAGVLVVHNHPSGDPKPSGPDLAITRRLAEAGALLGIPLRDHIIIAGNGYLSFSEEGLMPHVK